MSLSFLEISRAVSPEWHLKQVLKWLDFDNGRELDNVLVYASLELRCAIERNLFETLLLMKAPLTPAEEKKCRSQNGLIDLIKSADPNFRKTFIFTQLYLKVSPYPNQITLTDIGYLKRKWQALSNYCHKMLKPKESFESPDREFQKKGFKLIREILDYYYSIQGSQAGYMRPVSIKEPLKSLYDSFIKDEISEDQLKIRLTLMLPMLNIPKMLTIKKLK